MRMSLIPLAVALCVGAAAPGSAQMDWQTPHLESQRWKNLNRHQQRQRTQQRRTSTRSLPVCVESMVPRTEMRRVRAGYDRRVVTDGRRNAQLWVNGQARQARLDLIRRGICR